MGSTTYDVVIIGDERTDRSDNGTRFYFKEGYRSQTDHAYHATRGDFDKVLLEERKRPRPMETARLAP